MFILKWYMKKAKKLKFIVGKILFIIPIPNHKWSIEKTNACFCLNSTKVIGFTSVWLEIISKMIGFLKKKRRNKWLMKIWFYVNVYVKIIFDITIYDNGHKIKIPAWKKQVCTTFRCLNSPVRFWREKGYSASFRPLRRL